MQRLGGTKIPGRINEGLDTHFLFITVTACVERVYAVIIYGRLTTRNDS